MASCSRRYFSSLLNKQIPNYELIEYNIAMQFAVITSTVGLAVHISVYMLKGARMRMIKRLLLASNTSKNHSKDVKSTFKKHHVHGCRK
jgi:hypothetical protein